MQDTPMTLDYQSKMKIFFNILVIQNKDKEKSRSYLTIWCNVFIKRFRQGILISSLNMIIYISGSQLWEAGLHCGELGGTVEAEDSQGA